MANIRVYIENQECAYYKIEDTGITFTWQSKLINEINSFSFVTTNTITLPLTKPLAAIFKSPTVIDTTNSVSNRAYYDINITWNDSPIIRGYIKLQRIIILDNDEYVEFTINPKEKDWITQFKDFKLTELDFLVTPNQEHTLTYSNIVTSETYLPATREYVYAPIDIGEVGRLQVLWVTQTPPIALIATDFYYLGEEVVAPGATFRGNSYGFEDSSLTRYDIELTGVADAFWNSRGVYVARCLTISAAEYYNQTGYIYVLDKNPYYWEVSDFYPCIRHNAIVRRCFERIGYGVTIVDSSEYFDDKYNFVHNIEQINKFEEDRTKFKGRVQPSGFSYTKTATHTWKVPFRNLGTDDLISSAKYTDTNSNNSTNVDNGTNVAKYTVTEACILGFEWNYFILHDLVTPVTVAATGNDVSIHIKQYDSGNILRRTITYDIEMDWSNYDSQTFDGILKGVFYMSSGDYVECEIEYKDLWLNGATISILDTNTLKTIYYPGGNYKNKTIRLNEYLPDRTAQDYIKDLAFINNWEFYTNERLKQVYIVREDYKRTGKLIDFTGKLNRTDAVELEEIGLQWPKKIYFNWLKDENDWSIKFIEQVIKTGLGNTYTEEELNMIARFGYGVITNLDLFTTQIVEYKNDIYAASLDKFATTNNINFNTVEMKGEEQWPHVPSFKRTDYEPRYLTITFARTLETNGIGGVTSVIYSIEGNTNHTTYPWASFLDPLHYGTATGLLVTKYAKRTRAIRYGWILRGQFSINENDVNTFVETYEDNNFRSDYQLQLKGVKTIGELLKVNNFSPLTFDKTEIEFILYRDDL